MLTASVSEADYHAERFLPPGPPALSASAAWLALTQSAEHAALRHPQLGGADTSSSRVQDEGTALHMLLLGAGRRLAPLPYENYRTKAAQQDRDEAVARGAVPLLDAQHDRLQAAADAIRRRLRDAGIELDGVSEVTLAWDAGHGVRARGRIDHILPAEAGLDLEQAQARVTVIDLKTVLSLPGRDKLGRDVVQRGAHVQAAAYTSGLAVLRPQWRINDFLWLVAEREPPFGVMVARPAEDMLELGQKAWAAAVAEWARCCERGFDGATRGHFFDPITVHAPAWAFRGDDE